MMSIDLTERERDVLLAGLAYAGVFATDGHMDDAIALTKRLASLTDDGDPTLHVSSRHMHCTGCGASAPAETFKHYPGCVWVARYG
jgi:hypothetical protein